MEKKETKLSVLVRKTVQEEQFEPISIELGLERIITDKVDPVLEQKIMARGLQKTLDEILDERASTRRNCYQRR